MATIAKARLLPAVDDQCVEVHCVDWKAYTAMFRVRSERPSPKIIYLEGNLYLATTSLWHQRLTIRLSQFVSAVCMEFRIPFCSTGRVTLRRRKRRVGVEGDGTYYLANEARIRGNNKINLRVDPPPDLAIEVVNTHAASAAVAAYRRIGVPEVWVCSREGFSILILQANGRYRRSDTSAAFPVVTAADIFHRINRPQDTCDTEWIAELRQWVHDVLAPRRRQGAGEQP